MMMNSVSYKKNYFLVEKKSKLLYTLLVNINIWILLKCLKKLYC